jgi:hypothetical protein
MNNPTNKVHLTVNGEEFNAEGSDKLVTDLFKAWKELIPKQPPNKQAPPPADPKPSRLSRVIEEAKTDDGIRAPWDIFDADEKKKLMTLRVNPTGETRDADAILLVLYGFKRAWNVDEVKVTQLKKCLNISGLRPERIDKTVAAYVHQFILKTGRGPGGKYRLTNPGFERADGLARSLFEKLV